MTATEFSGKTALVTGGSRGIGRAIALAFAARGAKTVIVYARDDGAAAQTLRGLAAAGEGPFAAIRCDVSDWASVQAAVGETEAKLGGPDILVNSAGIVRDGLLATMEPEDWRDVLDTNLTGAFHFMRAVASGMVVRRAGRIVNISSIAGRRGGKGQANYAASKGGLDALTRAAALELAPRGITVNAVAPGMIATEMSAAVRGLAGDRIAKAIPMRRVGEPGDVVGAVLFLASAAAAYITGQVIEVDGGLGAAIQ